MGLSLGKLGGQLSTNESWVKTLEHAYIRASQGDDAVFRVGSRFPILNATFAPIFNTPAISQVFPTSRPRAKSTIFRDTCNNYWQWASRRAIALLKLLSQL